MDEAWKAAVPDARRGEDLMKRRRRKLEKPPCWRAGAMFERPRRTAGPLSFGPPIADSNHPDQVAEILKMLSRSTLVASSEIACSFSKVDIAPGGQQSLRTGAVAQANEFSTKPGVSRHRFFEIVRADQSSRFANGDWRDVSAVLSIVDPFVRAVGDVPHVIGSFLTLCESAIEHYPPSVFIDLHKDYAITYVRKIEKWHFSFVTNC